jgi:hypothetical protein
LEIVAILLIVLLVMVLIGYPLALLCAGAVAAAPTRATGPMPETLSILLTTHDAAAHVGETLETMIAAVAAWPGHAEILVGDGSTDDTATIAERFVHRGVTVVRGATLARLAPIARGEILVMSDANTLFDVGTLPALIAPFADPMTGAVAGAVEALRRGRGRLAYAETLSRRWQIATRTAEDRLFGCTLADRGLYAIRCTLMPRLPADVAEEIFVPTAAIAAGCRVAFAPDARVRSHGARHAVDARAIVRNLAALWCRRALMNPVRTGWYAIALMRALMRPAVLLAVPPLWVIALLLAVRGQAFWTIVFAGLSAAAALGTLGRWAPARLSGPAASAAAGVLRLATEAAGFVLFAGGRYARGGSSD